MYLFCGFILLVSCLCFLSVSSLFRLCFVSVSFLFRLCFISLLPLFRLSFTSLSSLFHLSFLSLSSLFLQPILVSMNKKRKWPTKPNASCANKTWSGCKGTKSCWSTSRTKHRIPSRYSNNFIKTGWTNCKKWYGDTSPYFTVLHRTSPSNILIFLEFFLLPTGQRESPRPPGQNVLVERPH